MNDLIKINEKQIEAKEHNGEIVITAWDIAEVHEREAKEINQNFKYIQNRLTINEDYFIISRKDFESKFLTQKFIPNNVKEIAIFTESGYLMLTKTFNDDLSWKIQRELINNYFRKKENLPANLNSLDVLKHVTNVLETHDNKINTLEDKIENQITLDHGEQRRMQKAIRIRVAERSEDAKIPKGKLYSALHRTLWDTFDVPSYKDIKRKDYSNALNLINNWIEKADLRNEYRMIG